MSSTTIARSDAGTVQITLTIPWSEIEKKREEAVDQLAADVTVSGFRKGKAPRAKAKEALDPAKVLDKALGAILPDKFADAVREHNLRPAIYPKFELARAKESEDWQIVATTCDYPQITLGDYKKILKKADAKKDKALVEAEALETILSVSEVSVPELIIDDEVNARLTNLLSRIEKLGLSLESYLASLGKNAEELRKEYRLQAEKTLKLEFILGEIVRAEKLTVGKREIEEFAKTTQVDPTKTREIETLLLKRKAIDFITSLVR